MSIIIDARAFHSDIEDIVERHACSYMDALILYQERRGIEAETISAMVKKNPLLKAKLLDEQTKLRTIKQDKNKLRFD